MSTSLGDSGTESSGYTSIAMSKSSSSASNTTASTSPAEALPLEGLENVSINHFVGIANMRKAIDVQSKRLQEGVSNQQFLVFRPVTEVDLAKIDGERERRNLGGNTRLTHYTDTGLLIVKLMPSGEHESAHLSFCQKLFRKVIEMGVSDDDFSPWGATRYSGNTSSKEGDSCYKPSRRDRTGWPAIVFESGLSESLQRLRYDAKWWLGNSGGDVKIVVLIAIELVDKKLRMEKWELGARSDDRPVTRTHPALIPTKLQELTIANGSVTGEVPLVLEFEKIFLRPAILPEGDITFTAADLSGWADGFWRRME